MCLLLVQTGMESDLLILWAAYEYAPVKVNRSSIWRSAWAQAEYDTKQKLIYWIAIYNECVHNPNQGWGTPQLITMKLRDVHTNEVIATYGEGTGGKIR